MHYPIFFVGGKLNGGVWRTWRGGEWFRVNYITTEYYSISVDHLEYGPFGAAWPVLKATFDGIETMWR